MSVFCSKKFVVRNREGLHIRPAALFVQTANKFASEIMVHKGETKVDAKSLLGLLTMCATEGSEIVVSAKGIDAEEALAAITALFNSAFNPRLTQESFLPALEQNFGNSEILR